MGIGHEDAFAQLGFTALSVVKFKKPVRKVGKASDTRSL